MTQLVFVGYTLGASITLQYGLHYPDEVKGLFIVTVAPPPPAGRISASDAASTLGRYLSGNGNRLGAPYAKKRTLSVGSISASEFPELDIGERDRKTHSMKINSIAYAGVATGAYAGVATGTR